MSPQVTFKSNEDKAPQASSLVDSAGKPVLPAPRLREAVRAAYLPSHGKAPSALPPFPEGLEDLGAEGLLRVTGPDREKWLQGMQTNDLAAAPHGGGVAAVFLGGKGRIIAGGLVFRQPDELFISTAPELVAGLHAHLDKLLIMEDCELDVLEGLHRLRYHPGTTPPDAPAQITGTWQPLGLELLLPEAEAQALLLALPIRPRPEQVEASRIALGVPLWGRELGPEVTPIEAGLDWLLSFSKGCYVGQEVVAMATYRGRVAWNLVRLEVLGEAPLPGSAIDPERGGRGRVTSSTQVGPNAVFLGFVHKELIVPGSQVLLEDGRRATVLGLPFGSLPGGGVCA